MILYTEDEEELDDDSLEGPTGTNGPDDSALKKYLAEEEAYTKFIHGLLKQYDNETIHNTTDK